MKEIIVRLTVNGDRWTALIGENRENGIFGWGFGPAQALRELADAVACNEVLGTVGQVQAFLANWACEDGGPVSGRQRDGGKGYEH